MTAPPTRRRGQRPDLAATPSPPAIESPRKKVSVPRVAQSKVRNGSAPLVMLTAYEVSAARLADRAGVDILLVGDSLGMVVQGADDTLGVTIADVAYHARCVAAAKPAALVVADMPWLSYHSSPAEAVHNAGILMREGRAGAVKVEGGRKRLPVIRALLDAEIPVMGHIGLTPQSLHVFGGFKVQGKDHHAAEELIEDARALDEAGVFALVLEGIPAELAARITEACARPTIGIGAGSSCDGQVLVWHDVLGLSPEPRPRFVRAYENLSVRIEEALRRFADDVRTGQFPDHAEAYHAPVPARAVASSARRPRKKT